MVNSGRGSDLKTAAAPEESKEKFKDDMMSVSSLPACSRASKLSST